MNLLRFPWHRHESCERRKFSFMFYHRKFQQLFRCKIIYLWSFKKKVKTETETVIGSRSKTNVWRNVSVIKNAYLLFQATQVHFTVAVCRVSKFKNSLPSNEVHRCQLTSSIHSHIYIKNNLLKEMKEEKWKLSLSLD